MKYMSKFKLLGWWGWGEIYEENIICFPHIFLPTPTLIYEGGGRGKYITYISRVGVGRNIE
jgi:hypothetical protein